MSEEQVCKEVIEQVGYQEFYRYFQEKTTLIEQQRKEIERLNNIINELEKELDRGYRDLFAHELVPGRELITNIKNYLQELKGSDNK